MADKKEVLDYLRNRQKAAEIEAKVNGINLWVLLGAIALVSWELATSFNSPLWNQRELVLRILLCGQAAFLFFSTCQPSTGIRTELRFNSWRASHFVSPALMLVEGALLLFPSVAFFLLVEKYSSATLLALYGLITTTIALEIMFRAVRGENAVERFPAPTFGRSPASDIRTDLIFAAIFLFVFCSQVWSIVNRPPISAQEVKSYGLAAALYLLALIAVRRKVRSNSLQWTYELETDLLVGAVTPEAAVRRVEHRALGPKVQDVVDGFFDDLEGKWGEFNRAVTECFERLDAELKDIPEQYKAERSDRIKTRSKDVLDLLAHCEAEIESFSKYLDKMVVAAKADKRLAAVLDSLTARAKSYRDKIKESKDSVETSIRRASSGAS